MAGVSPKMVQFITKLSFGVKTKRTAWYSEHILMSLNFRKKCWMEHRLEKAPENKWEMERSPLTGHNSGTEIELLCLHCCMHLFVMGESSFTGTHVVEQGMNLMYIYVYTFSLHTSVSLHLRVKYWIFWQLQYLFQKHNELTQFQCSVKKNLNSQTPASSWGPVLFNLHLQVVDSSWKYLLFHRPQCSKTKIRRETNTNFPQQSFSPIYN